MRRNAKLVFLAIFLLIIIAVLGRSTIESIQRGDERRQRPRQILAAQEAGYTNPHPTPIDRYTVLTEGLRVMRFIDIEGDEEIDIIEQPDDPSGWKQLYNRQFQSSILPKNRAEELFRIVLTLPKNPD